MEPSFRKSLTLGIATALIIVLVVPALAKPLERTRARFRFEDKINDERPKGKADWRLKKNLRSRLKINMQHLPGTSVHVTACGMDFGEVPVNAFGEAKVKRVSKKGDTVPTCSAGETVLVTGTGFTMNGTFADK